MDIAAADTGLQSFIEGRQQLLDAAPDEALKAHFQAEIDLVKSWGTTPGGTSPGEATPNGTTPDDITADGTTPDDVTPGVTTPGGTKPPINPTPSDGTGLLGGGDVDDTDLPVGPQSNGQFPGNLPSQLEPYKDIILQASSDTGVPAALIAAQVQQESNGDPNAVSINPQLGTTDRGLMQVSIPVFEQLQQNYPEVFAGRSHDEIGTDPELAINAGSYHMKDLNDQFGDWDVSLRGYVSGTNGINVQDPHDSSYSPGTDPNYVTYVNQKLDAIMG